MVKSINYLGSHSEADYNEWTLAWILCMCGNSWWNGLQPHNNFWWGSILIALSLGDQVMGGVSWTASWKKGVYSSVITAFNNSHIQHGGCQILFQSHEQTRRAGCTQEDHDFLPWWISFYIKDLKFGWSIFVALEPISHEVFICLNFFCWINECSSNWGWAF